MSSKSFDLSAFGELLIDFTYQGLNEYGMKMFAQNAGGAPANVAVVVAKLGLKTSFVGKVGLDMHGEFLSYTLEEQGVNIDGLIKCKDYFTTLAFVDIGNNGERTFSFARQHGADAMIECSELNTEIIKDSRIFHVGSLSLTNEVNKEATYFALKMARKNNVLISYDPNYRDSLWENELVAEREMRGIIQYADLMKISDEETLLLTGESNVIEAGKKLLACGVKIVVVTCGDKGAYLFYKGNNYFVPCVKTKVVDTTGAGDAFWGGFLFKVLQLNKKVDEILADELVEAAEFASIVASRCISKQGAIPAMPDLEQIKLKM